MPRYGDNFTRVDVEIFPNVIFISLTDNSFLNSIYYILTNPLKYLFHRLFSVFVMNLSIEMMGTRAISSLYDHSNEYLDFISCYFSVLMPEYFIV